MAHRDETYAAALAGLVEAIHIHPLTAVRGDGDTPSSDGQFFLAGGHGEARAEHNARYGSEPGVKFYTHLSGRFAPFHTKVIAANASEAPYVLDGLLHHETSPTIREHYTDAGGAADHMFGLCCMLGFRFAPRFRDLADRKLNVGDGRRRTLCFAGLARRTADYLRASRHASDVGDRVISGCYHPADSR